MFWAALLTGKKPYAILKEIYKNGEMEMEANANREYKDSVFSMYMSEPKRLIEVYNAIQETDYSLDTP